MNTYKAITCNVTTLEPTVTSIAGGIIQTGSQWCEDTMDSVHFHLNIQCAGFYGKQCDTGLQFCSLWSSKNEADFLSNLKLLSTLCIFYGASIIIISFDAQWYTVTLLGRAKGFCFSVLLFKYIQNYLGSTSWLLFTGNVVTQTCTESR